MEPAAPRSPERVADDLWGRVRALSARVEAMERVEREDGLDDAARAALDRARLRLARAADRARLADDLSDRLHALRRR